MALRFEPAQSNDIDFILAANKAIKDVNDMDQGEADKRDRLQNVYLGLIQKQRV